MLSKVSMKLKRALHFGEMIHKNTQNQSTSQYHTSDALYFLILLQLIYNFNVTMANNDSHIKPVLNTVMTPDRPLRLKFTPNF